MSGPPRVLLVDDEPPVLNVMRKMLARAGYDVTTAIDGRTAHDMVAETPYGFDIVVTDYTMPHLTGPELASRIWAIRPDMPVLLVTGYALDLQFVAELGFRGCIHKPVSGVELADLVREAIAGQAGP